MNKYTIDTYCTLATSNSLCRLWSLNGSDITFQGYCACAFVRIATNTEAASRMHCDRRTTCIVSTSDLHRSVFQFFFCLRTSQVNASEECIIVTLIAVLFLRNSASKHLNEDIDMSVQGASLERIKRYHQHLANLEKSLAASELWAVYRQRPTSKIRCCCNGALANFRGSSKWVMPSVEAAVAITWAVGKASGARFELTEWTFLNALSDI